MLPKGAGVKRQAWIRENERICYLRILRCASQTMRMVLRPFVEAVYPYNVEDVKLISGCTVFTVIREPVLRLVSGFERLCARPSGYTRSLPFWSADGLERRLECFVNVLGFEGPWDPHLMQQSWYLDAGVEPDEYFFCDASLKSSLTAFFTRCGSQLVMPGLGSTNSRRGWYNASKRPEENKRLVTFLRGREDLMTILHHVYRDDFKLYEEKRQLLATGGSTNG